MKKILIVSFVFVFSTMYMQQVQAKHSAQSLPVFNYDGNTAPSPLPGGTYPKQPGTTQAASTTGQSPESQPSTGQSSAPGTTQNSSAVPAQNNTQNTAPASTLNTSSDNQSTANPDKNTTQDPTTTQTTAGQTNASQPTSDSKSSNVLLKVPSDQSSQGSTPVVSSANTDATTAAPTAPAPTQQKTQQISFDFKPALKNAEKTLNSIPAQIQSIPAQIQDIPNQIQNSIAEFSQSINPSYDYPSDAYSPELTRKLYQISVILGFVGLLFLSGLVRATVNGTFFVFSQLKQKIESL